MNCVGLGIPKERIDEGELNNGKVRVMGDVNANKLREHLKSYLHKEVTIEKDPKKGSSNPNTSEGQLNNQLRNMSIQNGSKGGIDNNNSEKDSYKDQPKGNHQPHPDSKSIGKGKIGEESKGGTSGNIPIGESSQMGHNPRRESSQMSQLGQYSRDQPWATYGQLNQISRHPIGQSPLGQTGAQFGQMGQSGQHPMGQMNDGYNQESLWNHFSDDNVNGCTIM